MYLKFYGLAEKPFEATPNPRFLYLSPGHREALAQLHYGVQERQGFIMLTGRVGTGKTTLLHALRQRLDERTAIAYVFNSALSFDGILEYALEDLGAAKRAESRVRRLMVLNNFLIERERTGQNTVLIIDEAQSLALDTLEQVRLLSNFETTRAKLLQIILVGHPELRAKLDLPELRQLKQRVGLRCQIPPLTPDETARYIRNRLGIAGASDNGIFRASAIERITQYAGGIPRVINILSDHCLLFGYADRQRQIDRTIVNQAIEYMEEGMSTRRRVPSHTRPTRARLRWIGASSALALALVATAGLLLIFEPSVLDLVQSLGARP